MIALIVAMTKNNVIGKDGRIPWKIKGEQKRFKDLTVGKTIIMGRHSFEEIGKPLPNRRTILISNTLKYDDENCITVKSFPEALEKCKKNGVYEDVYIAGGARVYQEALPLVDTMYITVIDMAMEGDTFFPNIDYSLFTKTYEENIIGDINYTYYTFDKNK